MHSNLIHEGIVVSSKFEGHVQEFVYLGLILLGFSNYSLTPPTIQYYIYSKTRGLCLYVHMTVNFFIADAFHLN